MSRAARAERQPRAELARAPPHAVRHHAVDADGREHQRDRARSRRAAASPGASPPPTRGDVRQRARLEEHRVGFDLPRPRRGSPGSAASGSPVVRTNSVDAVAVLPLEREVQVGARRVGERGAANVADAPTISAVPSPSWMRLPTGFSPGKKRCGDRVADDHDRRRVGRVARVEEPAGAQRNLQRAEVAAGRRLPADFGRPLPGGQSDARAARAAPSSCCRSAASPPRRRPTRRRGSASSAANIALVERAVAPAARRSGRPAGRSARSAHRRRVKPGSTAISFAKLRSVRPAPISSTTASAISAATSADAARRAPPRHRDAPLARRARRARRRASVRGTRRR